MKLFARVIRFFFLNKRGKNGAKDSWQKKKASHASLPFIGIIAARTWSRVSELLKQGLPNEFQEKAIISYVGTRAASAFKLFCTEIWGQLPDGDEILANPETALCPVDDLGKLAILATSVGRAVTPELMNNLVKYINRMPDEFAMIAITDAARLNPENKKTAAFTTWQAEHSDLLHN